jgi:hypothetical protein
MSRDAPQSPVDWAVEFRGVDPAVATAQAADSMTQSLLAARGPNG